MSAQPHHNECERIEILPPDATHYEVLGITHQATEEEIKTQYHKLALLCHPDKNNDKYKVATQKIVAANEVLSNSEKRQKYNTYLDKDSRPPAASSYSPSSSRPSPSGANSGSPTDMDKENKTHFGPTKTEIDEYNEKLKVLLQRAIDHLSKNKDATLNQIIEFIKSIKQTYIKSDDYLKSDIYPLYRNLIETVITKLLDSSLLYVSLEENTKEWILLEIYRDMTFHQHHLEFFSPKYSEFILGKIFEEQFNVFLQSLSSTMMKILYEYIDRYKKIKHLENLVNSLRNKTKDNISIVEKEIIKYKNENFDITSTKERIQIEKLIQQAVVIIESKTGGRSKRLKLSKQKRQRRRKNTKNNSKKYQNNTKRSKRNRDVRSYSCKMNNRKSKKAKQV